MSPASIAMYLYTVLLKPAPLRWLANKMLLMVIPASVRLPEGRLFLNPRDPVVSGALAFGVYEPYQLNVFRTYVHEGDTVLDIGANIGLYTLIASKRTGTKGHVFAFEPEPVNAGFLEKNVKENNLRNVAVERCAASDTNGTAILRLDRSNKGNHSLVQVTEQEGVVTVLTRRLDDWLTEQEVHQIDAIKIDVQGAELLAFEGMRGILARMPVLFAEYEPALLRASGHQPIDMLTVLQSYGYVLFEIDESKKQLARIDVIENFSRRFTGTQYANILALSPKAASALA